MGKLGLFAAGALVATLVAALVGALVGDLVLLRFFLRGIGREDDGPNNHQAERNRDGEHELLALILLIHTDPLLTGTSSTGS